MCNRQDSSLSLSWLQVDGADYCGSPQEVGQITIVFFSVIPNLAHAHS